MRNLELSTLPVEVTYRIIWHVVVLLSFIGNRHPVVNRILEVLKLCRSYLLFRITAHDVRTVKLSFLKGISKLTDALAIKIMIFVVKQVGLILALQ